MAYFTTYVDLYRFEKAECRGCIHGDGSAAESELCSVLRAHSQYNDDSDEDINVILTMLVDGDNELGDMCSMRIAK